MANGQRIPIQLQAALQEGVPVETRPRNRATNPIMEFIKSNPLGAVFGSGLEQGLSGFTPREERPLPDHLLNDPALGEFIISGGGGPLGREVRRRARFSPQEIARMRSEQMVREYEKQFARTGEQLFPHDISGVSQESIEDQLRDRMAPIEHQLRLSDEEIGRMMGAREEIQRQAAISATQVQPYIEAAKRAANELAPEAIRGVVAATHQAEAGVQEAYQLAVAGTEEIANKIASGQAEQQMVKNTGALEQARGFVTDLESLAQTEIGINSQNAKEIAKKTGDLAQATANLLGVEDKAAREKLRVSMETNIRNAVYDKIESRRMMQFQRDQAEAAIRAELLNEIPFEGPVGETETAFSFVDQAMDRIISRSGVQVTQIQRDTLEGAFVQWVSNVAERETIANEVASATGIPLETVQQIYREMHERYQIGVQRHQETVSGTKFSNNSQLAQLVGQVAPEYVQSTSLYEIIKRRSEGDSHYENPRGTLAGLGGIEKDAYPALIGKTWEQVKNDPLAQIEALINYIKVNFEGDPATALAQWDAPRGNR